MTVAIIGIRTVGNYTHCGYRLRLLAVSWLLPQVLLASVASLLGVVYILIKIHRIRCLDVEIHQRTKML